MKTMQNTVLTAGNGPVSWRKLIWIAGLFASLALLSLAVLAQAAAEPAAQEGARQERAATAARGANQAQQKPGTSFSQELAEASREAAGEKEQNAEFKFSPSVRWLGKELGIGVHGAYWLAFILNFAVLALLIYLVSRSRMPAMFRSRTATIRRAMEEAGRASAEANRRLSEIEARLARLDHEIAAMQQQAERDAASEEEKLRRGAAEDARRIVETSEQEIVLAAGLARRELKAYAAELAVALAEKRIRIDEDTDAALVRDFAEQLGNGQDGAHGNGGKDGR